MFGGLCFMVNDKMCIAVETTRLMIRFNPEKTNEIMEKAGTSPMDFTKKIMKGYVYVDVSALKTQKNLEYWVGIALEFNSIAKISKRKNKI